MRPIPVLTKREGELGWLASTPSDYELRFAVAGESEEDAVERFEAAVKRWEALPIEEASNTSGTG